ncbi:MAG TPA: YciI family protein [Candidatus Polarisedimenticolia bacterium]|nr:YciI family protein [Candidatus Polarisedimenticolia bacterium]
MQYLLLIYTPELPNQADIPPEVFQQQLAEYDAFTKETRDRGLMLAGEALQPTETATSVRVRDGSTLVTDGPFAETKEALGGFYLLECKDLDEAIELAAKIPGARQGTIEVRPIWQLPETYGA